uniref:Secreted protein n=1 Tax=Aegilops tauschii subsp. strangulata TaxID=200361 RepID=A0A453NGD2_AEGTS
MNHAPRGAQFLLPLHALGLISPIFATLHIMREGGCVHRNTQANQMTRCLEQATHSQLHSLVQCCIKAV